MNAPIQMRFVVLIPAFQPSSEFPALVSELLARGVQHVVVVDDGSGPAFRPCFDQIRSLPGVRVCRHAINLGKGAALKTGINTILCEYPDASVVVTADADGQHHPDDIVAVAFEGESHPEEVVLGVRSFSREVPLRNRFGNIVTRAAVRVVIGQSLTDSQTGLRAIPYFLLPLLLTIIPQGYDFELDMLARCREKHVAIRELPIRTIYLGGNITSHFNPLLDSMRIYFVLLRFASVSLCTATIDVLIFSMVYLSMGSLLAAQVCARLIAMLFNFVMVKQFVFKSQGRVMKELLQYITLVAISGAVSFGIIQMLNTHFGLNILRAKLLAEVVLFLANFLVQRDVIFAGDAGARRAEVERQLRAGAAVESGSVPTEIRS